MSPKEAALAISEKVAAQFPQWILEKQSEGLQPGLLIKREGLLEVSTFLKNKLGFDFLRMIAGVDYIESLELVYELYAYSTKTAFKIKVRVTKEDPVVETVENIWPTANWHEREAYDLLGFQFKNHRDLRRILLPDDWEGHPLRKDYKEKENYNGVSTSREFLTGMPELPTRN